ncbi:hypothetical protein [Caballeronia sp. LZ032]|uniref:hypothetical protein n=1 Tax=Caballeronia sp. LZ032 TaxID=3038565 RepID=UPI0028572898|nr:hypothetical protein [Caballeronia sp. LZ032]MDR5877194.1 hypothetical protein [Caballeronia sp. LZ032]
MNIQYDAVVAPGAGQWYGQIIVSNLRYEDGSQVQVNKYLALNFSSPVAVSATDVWPSFTSWVSTSNQVQSTSIGDNLYSIALEMDFNAPHLIDHKDQITISINGDLTAAPDTYLNSFVIAADQAPAVNATVKIDCDAAPDAALQDVSPVITLLRGSQATPVTLVYGEATSVTLEQGDYTVQSGDVHTADETVAAPLIVTPMQLTLAAGATVAMDVTFGAVERTAALDIVIDELRGLDDETLSVTVTDKKSGATLAAFDTTTGTTTSLRSLPVSDNVRIAIDAINVNNAQYTFDIHDVKLDNALQTVTVGQSQVKTKKVDTTGFVHLPIHVTADKPLSQSIVLRLQGADMNYSQTITATIQTTSFTAPVKPGTYTVIAPAFVSGGIVRVVDAPASLAVAANGSSVLDVSIEASANLNVRGFPSYLSFGGCVDLTPGNKADLAAARATSIFVYAGTDGAGDSNVYLSDDPQTRALIKLARDTESALGNTQNVLPVAISYTCNLSLGNTPGILANADAHAHSFANYILALNIAMSNADAQHDVPAGFIVNPDFLGACQQADFGASYAMPVIEPLKTALAHWNIQAAVPSSITNTIAGYVLAVNWLTRKVAPKVTFGWQINLWGVGYSEWIYKDVDTASMAQQTADYVKSLGACDGPYAPDFLAIDRYEADDFTQRAYVNGYCYGPREWQRYFDFCENVSRALRVPVMPWQIPASRTPNTNDQVNADFDSQHWGTGGSCIMGDAAIGSDYHNVNPTILALPFSSSFPDMGANAEAMFVRSEPFDLSTPLYGDFPLRGIFAVLLGGGSTTGIVSSIGNPESWTRDKLSAYMEAPLAFDTPRD